MFDNLSDDTYQEIVELMIQLGDAYSHLGNSLYEGADVSPTWELKKIEAIDDRLQTLLAEVRLEKTP